MTDTPNNPTNPHSELAKLLGAGDKPRRTLADILAKGTGPRFPQFSQAATDALKVQRKAPLKVRRKISPKALERLQPKGSKVAADALKAQPSPEILRAVERLRPTVRGLAVQPQPLGIEPPGLAEVKRRAAAVQREKAMLAYTAAICAAVERAEARQAEAEQLARAARKEARAAEAREAATAAKAERRERLMLRLTMCGLGIGGASFVVALIAVV